MVARLSILSRGFEEDSKQPVVHPKRSKSVASRDEIERFDDFFESIRRLRNVSRKQRVSVSTARLITCIIVAWSAPHREALGAPT